MNIASRVTLRGQRSDDWDYLSALFGRAEVVAATDAVPHLADDVFRERYAAATSDGHNLIGEIALPSGRRRFVGLARLRVEPHRQRHVGRLLFVPHPDYYGTETEEDFLARVLQFATDWLGLQRVQVVVCAEETRARALYERHGFSAEATLRRYVLREGRYSDAHVLAWLPKSPASAPPPAPPALAVEAVDTSAIVVRAAEADDAEAVAEIWETGGAQVSPFYAPYLARASVRQALESAAEGQRTLVAEADDVVVGVVELRLHEGRRAHSADLTLSTAPQADLAVREALLAAALELGEGWLQRTRTTTLVYADQSELAAWWLAHGFQHEGTLRRAAYRGGRMRDLFVLARVREEAAP